MIDSRKCQACGAEITFKMNMDTARWLPMQRVRTVYLCYGDENVRKDAFASDKSGAEVWVSHFETCSDPSRFSRTKGDASP